MLKIVLSAAMCIGVSFAENYDKLFDVSKYCNGDKTYTTELTPGSAVDVVHEEFNVGRVRSIDWGYKGRLGAVSISQVDGKCRNAKNLGRKTDFPCPPVKIPIDDYITGVKVWSGTCAKDACNKYDQQFVRKIQFITKNGVLHSCSAIPPEAEDGVENIQVFDDSAVYRVRDDFFRSHELVGFSVIEDVAIFRIGFQFLVHCTDTNRKIKFRREAPYCPCLVKNVDGDPTCGDPYPIYRPICGCRKDRKRWDDALGKCSRLLFCE